MKKVIKEDAKKKNKVQNKKATKAVVEEEKKINKKRMAVCLIIAVFIIAIVVILIVSICCRSDKQDTNSITAEAKAFNEKYEKYIGNKKGNDVKELLDNIIDNANSNKIENELPDIKYVSNVENAQDKAVMLLNENSNLYIIESTVEEPNLLMFSSLRAKIDVSHYYDISISYNEAGYISRIIIEY